ncbi:hypothetical protein [Oceanobacillus alkalisoli]|uniref:hypothetical protein n=1 Tax=Oceanobacillus alkalisoli TaxID=2925113 RepID=UPI001EE460C9|nr:hypothetical protein [Oceanobacillus alkalisoli]MCG5104202.1 hypothetical protein [Oceanobacillus alkalisoli]
MQIIRADSKDATGIAKVHVDSWRATYKGIIPEDFLNNLCTNTEQNMEEKHCKRRRSCSSCRE